MLGDCEEVGPQDVLAAREAGDEFCDVCAGLRRRAVELQGVRVADSVEPRPER